VKDLISIVSYRTFTRWVAAAAGQGRAVRVSARQPGRPRTADEIRELVLRLGRETGWGSTRILAELRRLGVRGVSRTTVRSILREAGLDRSRERAVGTWDTFVRRHAATLWAGDFLTVRTATLGGFVDLYVLFFIHVGTRRAFVAGIAANPSSSWVTQQARNASMQMAEWGLPATHVLIDHDTKYTAAFDAVLVADGCAVKRVGPRARIETSPPSGSPRPCAASCWTTSWCSERATSKCLQVATWP
jgi:putative transposase